MQTDGRQDAFDEAYLRHRTVLESSMGLAPAVIRAGEQWVECLRRGGKILFCGNGGSASDAMHLSAELVGRFVAERRALPSCVLGANFSAVTAISNDYGYEEGYAREVGAIGAAGDVLVAISTSGNSPNILRAAEKAKSIGLRVQGWTGEGGGQLASLCDVLLAVPTRETARVQEIHILWGHILCQMVDAAGW